MITIRLNNPHNPISAPEEWNDYFSEKMMTAFAEILGLDDETTDLSEEQKAKALVMASGLLTTIIPLIDMLEIKGLSGADFILNIVNQMKAQGHV